MGANVSHMYNFMPNRYIMKEIGQVYQPPSLTSRLGLSACDTRMSADLLSSDFQHGPHSDSVKKAPTNPGINPFEEEPSGYPFMVSGCS